MRARRKWAADAENAKRAARHSILGYRAVVEVCDEQRQSPHPIWEDVGFLRQPHWTFTVTDTATTHLRL